MNFINSKKGIVTIVIVLSILSIAYIIYFFNANTNNNAYKDYERQMVSATKNFLQSNEFRIPIDEENGEIIFLKDLYNTLFIKNIMDGCDINQSYVYVKLREETLLYNPYLKCIKYESKLN